MSLVFWFATVLAGPPSQADLDACASAQTANDFEAWSSYLQAHADGICARAPAAADVTGCTTARQEDSVEAWGAYAALYPRGFCITEAKASLHEQTDDSGAEPAEPPRTRRARVGGARTVLEPTTAHGALEMEQIVAALAPFAEPTRGCGDGTARLHLSVLPDGQLAELAIDGVEEAVASCLADVLTEHLVFPSTDGPTRIVHRLPLDPTP